VPCLRNPGIEHPRLGSVHRKEMRSQSAVTGARAVTVLRARRSVLALGELLDILSHVRLETLVAVCTRGTSQKRRLDV
jgi:hypothetical protein